MTTYWAERDVQGLLLYWFSQGEGPEGDPALPGGPHRDKEASLPIVSRLQASEPGWLSATQLAVLATTTNPDTGTSGGGAITET